MGLVVASITEGAVPLKGGCSHSVRVLFPPLHHVAVRAGRGVCVGVVWVRKLLLTNHYSSSSWRVDAPSI